MHWARNAAFKQFDDGTMVMGDLVLLDSEINAVMQSLFDQDFEVSAVSPPPAASPSGPQLDVSALDGVLGYSGRANGSVVQYSIARSERITENGHQLLPAMGVSTALNFQPTGDSTAAITGDFILMGSEVEAVASGLRAALDQTNSAPQAQVDAPVASIAK